MASLIKIFYEDGSISAYRLVRSRTGKILKSPEYFVYPDGEILMTEHEDEQKTKWREETTAMVFLDAYGSTSSLDEPWEGHAYTMNGYAPSWLDLKIMIDGYEIDHDECITVLRSGEAPDEIAGYRLVYTYSVGETGCPECEAWDEFKKDHPEDPKATGPCPLCEGDKGLYWGEEWQGCVYAPIPRPKHWIAGSGEPGCLYDGGPDVYDSKDDAIEGLIFRFDNLGHGSHARMRRDLKLDGIHYFDRRIQPFAGASYCEITECDCRGKDHPVGED